MENAVWTSDLVEELMFRQFIKNEDVSTLVPPAPHISSAGYLDRYEQATKVLFAYVRNGPIAALSSQNVNLAPSAKHYGTPPAKLYRPNTAAKPSTEPPRINARTPTPKASRAPSTSKPDRVSPLAQRSKPTRVEWPADVPANNALKSNSRSKVAHLTAKRVAAQEHVDPDLIFSQNSGELPLHSIFAHYPKALKSISAVRNASGDWRTDTFTADEEQLYKKELGFRYTGPSQCMYGMMPLSQNR